MIDDELTPARIAKAKRTLVDLILESEASLLITAFTIEDGQCYLTLETSIPEEKIPQLFCSECLQH